MTDASCVALPLSTTWTTTPTPRTQIEQGLLDVFTQKTNAVLTNVVGPNEPIYLAGSKIAGVVPWVPAAGTIGMGINISATTAV